MTIRVGNNIIAGHLPGGGSVTVDSVMSSTSENPVQNKVIYVALNNKQDTSNLVTSISSSSTDAQYPSAKLFYDTVGDIEAALYAINSGGIQTVTLTFTLTGVTSTVDTLTVNSDTYTYSDFTNDSLSLEFTSGTNILWTASGRGKFSAYPSSGSLTLSENTNVTIHMDYT